MLDQEYYPLSSTPQMNRGGQYKIGGRTDGNVYDGNNIGGTYPVAGNMVVGGGDEIDYDDYHAYGGAGFFDDVWSGIKDAGKFIVNDVVPTVAPIALKLIGAGIKPKDKELINQARLSRIESRLRLAEITNQELSRFKAHIEHHAKAGRKASGTKRRGGTVILGTTESSRPPKQYLVESTNII